MRCVIRTLVVAVLLVAIGLAAFVGWGAYDTSATTSHTAPVYALLETTMRRAVAVRSAQVAVPPLHEPGRLRRGAACYRDHCLQCHGGPGVAPGDIGLGMQPLPGPLVDAPRRWQPTELYWIVRHGIKMSGMPAWELRLDDAALWDVTAFIVRLAELSPAGFQDALAQAAPLQCPTASAACRAGAPACAMPTADARPLQRRDADERARLLLRQYACVGCHVIPGVPGPQTHVGPPLDELARREVLVAGLPRSPEALAHWLRDPAAVKPGTAMPALGVTEAHAALMAQYLLQPR